jgi:hypothetical protein
MRVGHVAEGVHSAAEELDAGDRHPPLAFGRLQRKRRSRRRLPNRTNGDPVGDLLPRRDRLEDAAAEDLRGRESGDRFRSGIPEANDAGAVEQEHAVADIAEDAIGLGTRLDLVVQSRHLHREGDDRSQRLEPAEVVGSQAPPPPAAADRECTARAPGR